MQRHCSLVILFNPTRNLLSYWVIKHLKQQISLPVPVWTAYFHINICSTKQLKRVKRTLSYLPWAHDQVQIHTGWSDLVCTNSFPPNLLGSEPQRTWFQEHVYYGGEVGRVGHSRIKQISRNASSRLHRSHLSDTTRTMKAKVIFIWFRNRKYFLVFENKHVVEACYRIDMKSPIKSRLRYCYKFKEHDV